MDRNHQQHSDADKVSRGMWVLIGFIAIGAYFVVMEHRAHLSGLLSYLPFLLLLACPLMHLFMHRGHGDQGDHRSGRQQARPPREGDRS